MRSMRAKEKEFFFVQFDDHDLDNYHEDDDNLHIIKLTTTISFIDAQ